jgi:hypothetical protein
LLGILPEWIFLRSQASMQVVCTLWRSISQIGRQGIVNGRRSNFM